MADQAKYIRIFKEEAEEHLSSLSLGLLELEQRAQDRALIHELLRNAHTLKGSSKMLGLTHIGEVAHKMEDIFKAVEDGVLTISPALIDLLLMGTDTIRDIVDRISRGEATDLVDVSEQVGKLISVFQVDKDGPKAEPTAPVPAPQPAEEIPELTEKPKKARKKAKTREQGAESHSPAPVAQATPVVSAQAPALSAPGEAPGVVADAPGAAPKSDMARVAQAMRETIRVDTLKLDDLLNLAGELLINKIKLEGRLHRMNILLDSFNQLSLIKENGGASQKKIQDLMTDIYDLRTRFQNLYQDLSEDMIELDLFSQEIRNHAFALRVLPASTLFDEFQRTVRDFARELGKEIRLDVIGGETELDKQLLEELRPALIHIVRNSCDHGIEPPDVRKAAGKPREGTIRINAYHKGNTVIIEVTDDGHGIDINLVKEIARKRGLISDKSVTEISDEDALYFILLPGFTTAPIITDFSGRGVGMDVVKTNMERLKGDMTIQTELGKYTKVTLTAPLTLSILNSLLVQTDEEIFAIPLTFVEEAVRLPAKGIFTEAGRDVFNLRGTIIPLVKLSELLGLNSRNRELLPEKIPVVILKFRNQHLGLIVQAFLRDQEIVVKNLGDFLKEVPFASGVTILRQGEPALILNVFDIFSAAEQLPATGIKDALDRAQTEKEEILILVVDDSITTRIMEKSILEASGYSVELAVSGEEAEEKIAKGKYNLIVTDIEMPGMDGFELTRRIRLSDRAKEIPVVIVTSLSSDADKRKGIEVGAQAYIIKGTFDQTVLLNTVKSLVGEV